MNHESQNHEQSDNTGSKAKDFSLCYRIVDDFPYICLQGCTECFSPIKIRVNFTLTPSPGIPVRVLDAYSPKEAIEEVIKKTV